MVDPAAVLSRIDPAFNVITFLEQPPDWSYRIEKADDPRVDLMCNDVCYGPVFVRALKKRLGLTWGAYIILTVNLNSSDFLVMPADSKGIIKQLEKISKSIFGNQALKLEESFDKFSSEKVGRRNRKLGTNDGRSLANNIFETMAPLISANSSSDEDREMAMSCVKSTLDRLKSVANDAYDSEEQTKEAIERYSDYLRLVTVSRQNRIANPTEKTVSICETTGEETRRRQSLWSFGDFGKYGNDTLSDGVSIRTGDSFGDVYAFPLNHYPIEDPEYYKIKVYFIDGLEKVSRNELSNYNQILPAYFNRRGNYRSYDDEYYEESFVPDFKALGNHLANVIEEEINASIIQKIRALHGIRMPYFYRLYDSERGRCWLHTKNRNIDINNRYQDLGHGKFSVKPVLLGEAGCILNNYAWKAHWQSCLGIFAEKEFIDDLLNFANLRNHTSHPGPLSKEEFVEIYEAFIKISHEYIPLMVEIKRDLMFHIDYYGEDYPPLSACPSLPVRR